MARQFSVFEHERLTLSEDARGQKLEQSELERLYDFNDRNDNKYFTGIRDGVKFTSYVGVIQIGDLTIEVLPKSDREPGDLERWHGVLLDMLRICGKVNVNAISESNLRRRHHSVLESYFELYLDELEQLLRQGLVKKYRRKAGNATSLKGQILFSQHLQRNLIHQERFFTQYQVYDPVNPINQILLEGLHAVADFTRSPTLNQRTVQLIEAFPFSARKGIEAHHFDRLSDHRGVSRYQRALSIARMLLLHYSPSIQSGKDQMLALLFDMNALWEEYIYRMLVRAATPEFEVHPQQSKRFWESHTVRPDLIVTRRNGDSSTTFVIDTKWKVLDMRHPRPSDEDLKQMFVYNEYWSAGHSMLLYPTTYERQEVMGYFYSQDEKGEKIHSCKLAFVSVLGDDGKLNLNIGQTIFERLRRVKF
jgi:5-methylcytosine-specific restriction enzyme subunit McrC